MARYLLDTHALIFWSIQTAMSDALSALLDAQSRQGNLLVSAVSFWEAALLAKKGKIRLDNIYEWKAGLVENANIQILTPTATDMIDSTLLPDHHKDPFDRVLIIQANRHNALFVTRDTSIQGYDVKTYWL